MDKVIVIKGIEVKFTEIRNGFIKVDKELLLSLDDNSVIVRRSASEYFYPRLNTLLRQNRDISSITTKDFPGIKRGTASSYLSDIKRMVNRKETTLNPARIVRRVKSLGCLSILDII